MRFSADSSFDSVARIPQADRRQGRVDPAPYAKRAAGLSAPPPARLAAADPSYTTGAGSSVSSSASSAERQLQMGLYNRSTSLA